VHLARGIVEYQEGRYRVAALHAERAVGVMKAPGPLGSRAWKLWGDSLARLHSHGAAEDKYIKALQEALPQEQPELHFEIGQCRMRLGKYAQARKSFELVPLGDERAPEAIRALALIALETERFEEVDFWLAAGRKHFPEKFLDSWVDYALIRSALTRKDSVAVERLLADANKKFAPSDDWLILAQAAAEASHWSRPQTDDAERKQSD
jgi:tetratricopeptide (TPR) repeat protein